MSWIAAATEGLQLLKMVVFDLREEVRHITPQEITSGVKSGDL